MGVSVRIDLSGLSKLSKVAENLDRKLKDRRALNLALATTLRDCTRKRFETKKTPEGKEWTSPLVKSGDLRNKLLIDADDRIAKVGSNLVYAAIHQFGGIIRAKKGKVLRFTIGGETFFRPKVTIKANPYLGISEKDEEALADTVKVFAEACLDD